MDTKKIKGAEEMKPKREETSNTLDIIENTILFSGRRDEASKVNDQVQQRMRQISEAMIQSIDLQQTVRQFCT
jgi:hypothetical protein